MSNRDHFIASLDANPSDQFTRMVFADWLEENGKDNDDAMLAVGMRWMAENNKWPYFDGRNWRWLSHCNDDPEYVNHSIDCLPWWQGSWWTGNWRSRHQAEVILSATLYKFIERGITKWNMRTYEIDTRHCDGQGIEPG